MWALLGKQGKKVRTFQALHLPRVTLESPDSIARYFKVVAVLMSTQFCDIRVCFVKDELRGFQISLSESLTQKPVLYTVQDGIIYYCLA